jgi:molecular chaperone GrpE
MTKENDKPEDGRTAAASGGDGPPAETPPATERHEPVGAPTEAAAEQAEAAEEAAQLQADLAELQNRALRAQAELDNFRKRVYRQMEDERKYAYMPLLQDLLPVLDNLQRAVAAAEQLGDSANGLLDGVRLVMQQWKAVLEKHHCTAIDADGTLFDPHVHEAIAQFPSEAAPAGMVAEVVQTGYLLHDRVVRPARVVVSSGPPTPPGGEGTAAPPSGPETG